MKVGDKLYCIRNRDNFFEIINEKGNYYTILQIKNIEEVDDNVEYYDMNIKIIYMSISYKSETIKNNAEYAYLHNEHLDDFFNLNDYFNLKKYERKIKLKKLNIE